MTEKQIQASASSVTGKVQIYLSAEYDRQVLNLLVKVITVTLNNSHEKSENVHTGRRLMMIKINYCLN